jgi:hypothetical protein
VFLLIRPGNPVLGGGVVWLNAEDVSQSDRFGSFEDFFLALVDHNEALARHAQTRAGG